MSGPGTPAPPRPLARDVARVDGYAAIRDYGVIGDKRTAALVARDGSIDWMAVPTLDGPSAFGALLDSADGGAFALRPDVPFSATQAYVEDTNVLETTFATDVGTVRVTDALALPASRTLPWTQLLRRVDGLAGAVPMRFAVRPRFDDGATDPVVDRRDGALLFVREPDVLALQAFGAPADANGTFCCAQGDSALLVLHVFHDEPISLESEATLRGRLDETVDYWRRWTAGCRYDGPWRGAVRRSALALDLLVDGRTGAIAAAATMGLPERIGGERNYDYRYAWIRDANLTLEAMLNVGLTEQVHASLAWMLATIRATHPHVQPMYRLSGSPRVPDRRLDRPGYRGSRPVTLGNDARDQLQLGSYGDLFDMVARFVADGGTLPVTIAQRLSDVADHLTSIWRHHDSGIWELPERRPYTQSKLASWLALDRAVGLARAGILDARRAAAWQACAQDIRRFVRERCWSPTRGAYARDADSDALDCGLLLAARASFLLDEPERLGATLDVLRAELGAGGPLLYRASGMADIEGAFLACSFWMVECLARIGRVEEAVAAMDALVALAGPTGLLSEQVDPQTGALLGNLPQALSHLALINAAVAIAQSAGPPADQRVRAAGAPGYHA
jgi:GH15 family glucan-1,4-alpha-glucosidase